MVDAISLQELDEAKQQLVENLNAFYKLDDIGYQIRENFISFWKKQLVANGIISEKDSRDMTILKIAADLENDIEIKNAIAINENMQLKCN